MVALLHLLRGGTTCDCVAPPAEALMLGGGGVVLVTKSTRVGEEDEVFTKGRARQVQHWLGLGHSGQQRQ